VCPTVAEGELALKPPETADSISGRGGVGVEGWSGAYQEGDTAWMAGRQGEGYETTRGMGADDRRPLDTECVEACSDGVGMVFGGVAGGRPLRAPKSQQVWNYAPTRIGELVVGGAPVPARATHAMEQQEGPTTRSNRTHEQSSRHPLLAAAGSPGDRGGAATVAWAGPP